MQPMYPAPPPAPRPRSPYLAPLIALSALLVVLLVAIGVVAAGRFTGGTPTGSGRTPTAGPTPDGTDAPDIDECVVGNWRVTSHEERVAIDGVGTVTFTGSGATLQLYADGTGVTDYGDGTDFTSSANGRKIELSISGTVRFGYETSGGTVSFHDMTADGTAVVRLDGTEIGRTPLEGSDDPAKYTCDEETLVESTDLYRVEMERKD